MVRTVTCETQIEVTRVLEFNANVDIFGEFPATAIVIKYACFGECDNERFVGTRGKKDNSCNDSARARLYESIAKTISEATFL